MSHEDDEFSEIYRYTDFVRDAEPVMVDGKEVVGFSVDFGLMTSVLTEIEKMVHEIEFGQEAVAFIVKKGPNGKPIIEPKFLGTRYWSNVMLFFQHHAYDERYVFSPHVESLRQAFVELNLHPADYPFHRLPIGAISHIDKIPEELFNDVLARVASIVSTSEFRERVRVRTRNAERNEETGLAIEQKVFEEKSRHLVLMLHFGYKVKYRSKMTLDDIQKHRERFFNNCRSNKLLRGIVDYIWKIEQGDDSGLHLHLLIFYTAESCRDVQIARQIGEYWVKLTGGMGQYWNSNANRVIHERYGHGIGTGEINWDEDGKREALRTNIRYMAKADQFLKMKRSKRCRLFGTSQVSEKKKIGRPRQVKSRLEE